MIQRIQSVFLLLVGICMLITLLLPLWSVSNDAEIHSLYALFHKIEYSSSQEAEYEYIPYVFTGVLAIVGAIIAFFEITRYKNRILQMKIGALNSLVMAATIGLTVWLATDAQSEWLQNAVGTYQIPGFFMPAAAMLLNVIANRFIRKDEKLVRSVDRLR